MFKKIWKTKGPEAAMEYLHDILAREGVEVQIKADVDVLGERETESGSYGYGNRFNANATSVRFQFDAIAVIDEWVTRR